MSKEADSIIERWNEEIWNKGDMSAVDDLVAEDFVQYVATSLSARGREALKQDVRSVRAAFAGRFTTEETIVDRTRIASAGPSGACTRVSGAASSRPEGR